MTPYLDDGDIVLYQGHVLDVLRELPAASVHCCVTSPPYWGLRDYGVDGQIGLEETPEAFVAAMVDVFREVRRVLRADGTLWLNLGDSYAGSWGNQGRKEERGQQRPINGPMLTPVLDGRYPDKGSNTGAVPVGLKPKDFIGIPWRVALALQADGWWLRSDIIWAKPNPMPESVTDRPTSAHEHVFLLAPSSRYFYDADSVREADSGKPSGNGFIRDHRLTYAGRGQEDEWQPGAGRNIRNVWTIATQPTPEAHFATFPEKLVERCLKAGTSERGVCAGCGAPWRRVVEATGGTIGVSWHGHADDLGRGQRGGDNGNVAAAGWRTYRREERGWETTCPCDATTVPATVLDPFVGSGTTALVARRLGLHAVGIDLNPDYLAIAARRLQQLSLFAGAS